MDSAYYIALHHAYSSIERNNNGTRINGYFTREHNGYGNTANEEQDSAGIKFVYRGIPRIDFRFDGYSFDP